MVNRIDMSGTLTAQQLLNGKLSAQGKINGEVFIPETIASKIYYDTTEMWNSQNKLVAQKGDALIGTFKTPSAIAKNSSSVWSRWYKINGIGV